MQPAFYKPMNAGPRPWGSEDVVALVPGVATLKVLRVQAGHKGRFQRHHRKDESGHLYEGLMIIRWLEGESLKDRLISQGDSYHFPIGCIHQEEAVTDCIVLEVSTPYANDREGCEHKVGMTVPPDALPSTSDDEVTEVEKWW